MSVAARRAGNGRKEQLTIAFSPFSQPHDTQVLLRRPLLVVMRKEIGSFVLLNDCSW